MSRRDQARADRGRRRGASAVELALLTPLLLVLLLGAIDFCRLFYTYTTITNCARNGALWLADPLAPTQSPYPDVTTATLADGGSLSPALTSSNVATSSGGSTVSVTVTYNFQLLSSYLGFSSVSVSRQVTMNAEPLTPN